MVGVFDKWDMRFAALARVVAYWSKDPACKVGAVIVSPSKRKFSVGYNGFPVGVADTQERLTNREVRVPLTSHAELNAILNSACDLRGWTMYTTKPPCLECAKAIIQAGIAKVVAPPLQPDSKWHCDNIYAKRIMEEAGVKTGLMCEAEAHL